MAYLRVIFVFLLYVQVVCGQEKVTPKDSLSEYAWLKLDMNKVQFYDRKALEHFYQSWKQSKAQRVSVVMLGDSHLQAGSYPDQIRRRLHQTLGDGGKGMMFAYSAANTYSTVDYKTSHKKTWVFAKSFMNTLKLPLGISGMAVKTKDTNATLSFKFKHRIPAHYRLLKIFFKQDVNSYDIKLKIDEQEEILVKVDTNSKKPFTLVSIPSIQESITLSFSKSRVEQDAFEFYGMSLESDKNNGAILHNGGVGAAKYNSVLRQELFEQQLPYLNPDLVIIDFGTNDFLMTDKIDEKLESQIIKVIDKVRLAAPNASILLTTAQDLYWKKINIKSGLAFTEIIHRVAKEKNCAVYDWYWVAGGQTVMRDWVKAKIAQNDMIHLNEKGYRIKGDLLFEALRSTINEMEQKPEQKVCLLQTDSLKAEQAHLLRKRVYAYNYAVVKPKPKPDTSKLAAYPVKNDKSKTSKNLTHIVVAGDTLYALAIKYKVSVDNLMKWNKLSTHHLKLGQILIIKY